MSKRPSISLSKISFTRVPSAKQSMYLLVASLIFFAGALGVWVKAYYLRPSVVFWSAIEEALNTPGVLKESYIKTPTGTTTVLSTMRFEDQPSIQLRTILTQMTPGVDGQPDKEARAVAESLGLPAGDFQRYIETPSVTDSPEQKAIFEQIVGKWVQTGQVTEGKPNQIYIDGLFSAIPFGNLTDNQRDLMIRFGREGNDSNKPIFEVDFNAVEKSSRNGRPIYTFKAKVATSPYAKWYQQYLAFMGFEEFAQSKYTEAVGQVLGLSGEDVIQISVDALSHTVVGTARENALQGTTIDETIKSLGIAADINTPTEFLSREQFQSIISGSGEGQAQPVQ